MKIVITGSQGLLGGYLVSFLKENSKHEIIGFSKTDLDITNETDVYCLLKLKPNLIIHCAAYTKVDKAEGNFIETYNINVNGTLNIVNVCSKLNTPLIYISTDHIFNGKKEKPYTILDKPSSINVYGETKLRGEYIVQLLKKYFIIRTSWLYGANGNNFISYLVNLSNRYYTVNIKKLEIINDQISCPTNIFTLVHAINNLIQYKNDYGIYHVTDECEGISLYQFAQNIPFKNKTIIEKLIPINTEEYKNKSKKVIASRPKYSVLVPTRIKNFTSKDWKFNLKASLL